MKTFLFAVSSLFLLLAPAYAETKIEAYGFIKTSWVGSSQEVVSFGENNHSAVTHAKLIDESSPDLERYSKAPRSSFQAQQSRAGFKALTNEGLTAKIEVDFVERNESTHGASENVRLRLAHVIIPFGENLEFSVGQQWLTFSALAPTTYNIIQINFYSGKTGFIGQEASLKYTQGKWKHYIAVGAKGINPTPDQNSTELGLLPAFTFKSEWSFDKGVLGGALMHAQMQNSQGVTPNIQDSSSTAIKVFADYMVDQWKLVVEAYYSENPEDLNLLALRGARYDRQSGNSSYVTGGFISARHSWTESVNLFGGFGFAKNENAADKFATGTLAENQLVRVGADKKIFDSTKLFFEASSFKTAYVSDVGQVKHANAMVYELGLMHRF